MGSGAMERHSGQQRQIAAHKAGMKMIWWDKTVAWNFPLYDCEHEQENLLIGDDARIVRS
jgi:hypothetical protein